MDIRPGNVLEGPNGTSLTIDQFIDHGGFGQVFAGHLQDGTKVAVKTVLTASLTDDELKALQNEAALSVGIEHPNVVKVLYVNSGSTPTSTPPYIVMEYLEGGTLRALIERTKTGGTSIPLPELRAMYLQIARGMEAVNARVVHRDLKPANILIDPVTGNLKIADFGLAKLVGAATRTHTFKGAGTLAYQSPESFDGGPNQSAMDIYSGGVVFYELATLSLPVEPKPGALGAMGWRNAHLLSPPRDLRTTRPDIPADLVQLIVLMLQKDHSKRPASWAAIRELLEKGGIAKTGPNVSSLLQRATANLVQRTEEESRRLQERQDAEERTALLKQAFDEPLNTLQDIVSAFNTSTATTGLTFRRTGDFSAEVSGAHGVRLQIGAEIIADLGVTLDGIARIIAGVRLAPTPQPKSQAEALHERDSFGSFNLVYRVRTSADRFGSWSQIRFEISPLIPKSSYPHWFALDLQSLPRQLAMLRAMGEYQHEQRTLDNEWFEKLLLHLV